MLRSPLCRALIVLSLSLLGPAPAPAAMAAGKDPGAVYVATNAVAANAVLVFSRSADGELDPTPAAFQTGGQGTATGLGNQGGLVLGDDGRLLFVVNAGSDTVSVFGVERGGLELLSVTPSGGRRPVSVTRHKKLLYVLNAGGALGGSDSIAGFRIEKDGDLTPISGSVRPLSAANTGPAQIGFDTRGCVLVVTEKATNMLTTYVVDSQGRAGLPQPQASAGATPFGFAFGKRDRLFVSEAFGGAPGASTVTSYQVMEDGALEVLDPLVPTTETAACWVAVSDNGHFAYVTNTGDDSISGFEIERDGELDRLDSDGVTAVTGGGPIDLDFSDNGRFLYTLNNDGSLSAFRRIGGKGALGALPGVSGLPAGSNGLAAR